MNLSVETVKTDVFHRQDELLTFLEKHLTGYSLEGKVLAITSKIISLAENRIAAKSSTSKKELIEKEADVRIEPRADIYYPLLAPHLGKNNG